ncbi:hypothetical protein [Motilibacter aurantiacus]|uniref:hypothetical protein n=1 Tax=Motilibacter aurantiacus TaxID=2714955 RepID=UPI00140E2A08|nr:hypothetical protein [Motilibacter aurantiacus]NHC45621.1 hypothetical protein [Motilibacter aurantiacus]
MRDNGLPGTDFVAVADLEPQLADAMLELLRDAGMAAYADAAAPRRGPYNEYHLPDRPTDRLFVERAAVEQARQLLRDRLPSLRAEYSAHHEPAGAPDPAGRDVTEGTPGKWPEVDEDVWAGIVASFRAPSADPVGRWSAQEDVDPAAEAKAPAGTDTDVRHEPLPDPGPAPAPRPQPVAREDEEHFEPPAPPPLPRVGLLVGSAWAAVLGAPIFFIVALFVHVDVQGWLGLLGVGAFVAGFLVLVSRLGDGPEDGWDDGAVV